MARESVLRALAHHKWGSGSNPGAGRRHIWVEFAVVCSLLCFQAPVAQKVGSAIHWINLYRLHSAIGFPNTSG